MSHPSSSFLSFLQLLSSLLSYLRDNFKIIDPTKICAYGWGYGAYLTSILLTKDSKRTFLCYIAVAPIVSFQFYSEFPNDKNDCYTNWLKHFWWRFILYGEIFRLQPNDWTFSAGSWSFTSSFKFPIEKLSSHSWHCRHARSSTAYDVTDKISNSEGRHLSTSGEKMLQ